MSEIVENYVVPEIYADEIANVRIINRVMRFHYWEWQECGGILQRVLVAKFRMPLEGVLASRPLITAAMNEQRDRRVSQLSDLTVAH